MEINAVLGELRKNFKLLLSLTNQKIGADKYLCFFENYNLKERCQLGLKLKSRFQPTYF